MGQPAGAAVGPYDGAHGGRLDDDRLPVVVDARTTQTTHLLAISARVTLHDQVIYDRSWNLPLDADGQGIAPVTATGPRDSGVGG